MTVKQAVDFTRLAADIKAWGKSLGFQEVGITDCDISKADDRLLTWLEKGFQGTMTYLERNSEKRRHPEKLIPGTVRIICVRLDYLPADPQIAETLRDKTKAYVSRYALGRDYHKVIRGKLNKLAKKINEVAGEFGHRAFTDSAPVHEKPLAEKAGLGWMGKNTLILNKKAGSWFFLGELFTDLPLPCDEPVSAHCGSCTACLDICPTKAFTAPYILDARRCISYLTIEYKGSIDPELRPLMGNRIYGCDDCQLICPWNKFAKPTTEEDFKPRHGLKNADLIELFAWTEEEFLKKTEGSAMRRAGHESWLRNIAIALGNAPSSPDITAALKSREHHPSEIVREHVSWGLQQHIKN